MHNRLVLKGEEVLTQAGAWLRQVLHSESLRGYFAKSVRFWPNHFTAIESRMYHQDCEHV